MESNQTKVDRIIRIVAGLFVLSLSLIGPQAVWGLLGVIPLVTGLMGYDPIHGVLRYRTWPQAPVVAESAPR
jgi:hypothetical protein